MIKFTKLATIASVTSIVLFAGLGETIVNAKPATANTISNTTLIATKQDRVLTTGGFVSVDKPTRGEVKILEIDGKRYLELASNFKTRSGPALEIILHRNSSVPTSIGRQDYVTLSKLKKVSGTQRYLIPNNVDLKDFQSVAIWCRQFNVTFGFASI